MCPSQRLHLRRTALRHPSSITYAFWASLTLVALLASPALAADQPGARVSGDYRYAFHEPETEASAQTHACEEAARAAVSRSEVFRDATAGLVDSALLRRTIDTIRHEGLKDVQIVQQFVKGAVASCRVTGRLEPQEVERIVLASKTGPLDPTHPVVDQNRAIKILRVTDETDGHLSIMYQAVRRLDWLSTAYQGSLRDEADIRVEFFDERGQAIKIVRVSARKTPSGEDAMNAGDIGTQRIPKPAGTHSFRVWVSK